ncbi:MAG: holin [Propionibacteriaceae bacterium]|jgi:hypothetical protein|nr:holin [Propionibacteriaceae bacterium]
MWTLAFWKNTAERAIKTLAQTMAVMLGADGFGLLDADWATLGSVAGMAALLSVLTSIGSGLKTGGNPSLTNTEELTPRPAATTEEDLA